MAGDSSLIDRITRFLRKAPEETGRIVITEDKDVRHSFDVVPQAGNVAALAQDVHDALLEDADAEEKTVFRQVRVCTAEGMPLATLNTRVNPRAESELGAGLAGVLKMLALHSHQSHQEMIEASREMRSVVRETIGAITPVLTAQTSAISMLSDRLREATARVAEAEQIASEAVTVSTEAAATVEATAKDDRHERYKDKLFDDVVAPALKKVVEKYVGPLVEKELGAGLNGGGGGEPHGQA